MSETSGMNGGRDGNGSLPDGLSLALAVHQTPSQFYELLHGKADLPDDIGLLLRLAGGAALPEGMALPPFSAPTDVREAALFFIEQVLLAHDANHYRVLGVRPTASLDELKENHRLLMRLFHPDRRVLAMESERKAAHAARINLAYTTLRQPATRTAYDLSLRQARQAAIQMPQMRPTLRRHAPEPATPILSPRVARHLPQLVLGGFALLAMAAVGVVYLNQTPTGAIGMGDDFSQAQALPATSAPVATQHDNPQIERLKELAAAWSDDETSTEAPGGLQLPAMAMATTTTATSDADKLATAPSAVPAVTAAAATTTATIPLPAKAITISAPPTASTSSTPPASAKSALAAPRPTAPAPAPASVAKPQTASSPLPRLPVTATSLPAEQPRRKEAMAAPVAPTTPPVAARAETPPTPAPIIVTNVTPTPTPTPAPEAQPTVDNRQESLDTLLGAFTLLYEKGDLEAFLALFDENARAENGGKTRIRNDYDNLFRTTAARKLYIYDMNWVQDGDIYRGQGGFQAKVRPKGAASQRIYDGIITLEILKRPAPASLLIRKISHKTG
ncbi:conserved protein of unknown function [Sterolibacterium denitrificans]|uniref:J domain-containing protein n=1 Tax=Sterolibacterium denitrificans TaxID=157592 RepID=A0A7Z7MUG6_9PROT|nr:J domain-containing protein [Sterolibacterium denitrificans]SMB22883.1 conserved protein of unknown function [Sterolibacterium denitrificans]